MKSINLQQELKFIHSEKMKTSDKGSLTFELLNIADVLISNYVNARTRNLKSFYKIIYQKTKTFYLGRTNSNS